MCRTMVAQVLSVGCVLILLADASVSAFSVVGWGEHVVSTDLNRHEIVAVSSGGSHSLALRVDGAILGWGENHFGQASAPDGNDYVAIDAGDTYSLAVRSDGTIVAWGVQEHGLRNLPKDHHFVAVAAGDSHALALTAHGRIVAWGENGFGQATPPDGNDYVGVAAGATGLLAVLRGRRERRLKSDTRVDAYGTVDEANACIGLARLHTAAQHPEVDIAQRPEAAGPPLASQRSPQPGHDAVPQQAFRAPLVEALPETFDLDGLLSLCACYSCFTFTEYDTFKCCVFIQCCKSELRCA